MDEKQYLEILNQQGEIAYTVDKAYLLDLQSKNYQILPFKSYRTEKFDCQKEKSFSYTNHIRALQVKKWVFDKEQNIGDCFKNVLSLFALGNDTIALVVKRKQTSTEMYFVIQNPDSGLVPSDGFFQRQLAGLDSGNNLSYLIQPLLK